MFIVYFFLLFIRGIVLGLSYLHKKKVAHRKLRTSNVFITLTRDEHEHCPRYTAKIGDLSSSKRVKDKGNLFVNFNFVKYLQVIYCYLIFR